MVIELSPELEARIRAVVDSGRFQSEQDCVERALSSFFEDQESFEETRALVEADLEAGWVSLERGDLIDGDEAIAILRQRHTAHKVASGTGSR